MTVAQFYPIGTPGQPWGDAERAQWRARQQRQRSYHDDVVAALERLDDSVFDVIQYGQLDYAPDHYPLFAVVNHDWNPALPTALITGGVHGYETSGVHGALQFLEQQAERYLGRLNLIVAPCVSPWGYERIQRWNPDAIDPNRSFRDGGQIVEAATLMAWVAERKPNLLVHLDLHETTDSDLQEFDPARCARDGKPFERDTIPDGFYVIGNSEDPQAEFQKALIAAVAPITHIAPADADGNLVGLPLQSPGVVWGESRSIGACAGFTDARFATTTEVYPDSPRTNPQECNDAQVAAVCAGLDFALAAQ
ncbi:MULTISPECIES: M14 family metallopeptidase [Stenotrophomonas]|uniref:M14 family metallopeptidase n=1 Tax=Stenotrophomonas TaxID=40323 RepID=UPI000DA7F8FB|nr:MULTISPECIES: M14 family metallocarboxypeptidase [Stenotrophomonas]AYA91016.1 peptidase [Stenotrophomonas sp. Pemsol]MCU1006294.1 M14 family metallocarboxypeptidase [Stenotrophomonas maltophilia]PZS99995.1 peptidase [Stenotrophomonas maltophilia]PZT15057.1 peptidase [Stenotrophomonas maltophilia]PZT43690.1 peptidase [Stenotrophomonas maltophilia]